MADLVKVVGVGAGGHAKILVELLQQTGKYELVGLTDMNRERWSTKLMGYPALGGDDVLADLYAKGIRVAFIGVGAVSSDGTRLRAKLFRQVQQLGFDVVTLTHPQAAISPSARIGAGSVVMAGTVLSADVRLGDNVVIYSGTVMEHDSVIESHVHLSPGVTIAGGVTIQEGAFIGAGASVIQGVRVGRWATVGAGAVVLKDVPDNVVAFGVPARPVRETRDILLDSGSRKADD